MFNFLRNEKPELFRKFLMALAFSALGYCGNYLSLPVALGVDFIFGSIFSIFAVVTLGLWWGIGVSIVVSSYTYLLWNHPYAIIIFTVEILWIGLALKRGKKNILLIDSLYWLILGIPLVIAFYSGVQQLDTQSVAIIVLKQAVNGIFNAMVASIILSNTPLRQWMLGKKSTRLPTYSTIIFHLIAVSLMFPSLSLLLYMNHRVAASQQRQAMANVQENAHEARAFIQMWVGNHVNAARVIAGLGEKYPPRPSPELQEELIQIRKLFPDYHNVFLGDADATTIAFDPPVNERGESTIGINFADRAWFKQLENTLKPVVSDVFMGRGGIFSPIFTISVPLVRDEKLVWFGLGAVNLEKLNDHLATFSYEGDLSLVDRNGNIIVSTNKNRKPLTSIVETNKGTIVTISSDVSLWVPGTIKNVSIMNAWKGAYYFTRVPIDKTNWILVTENSVKPMQKYLYSLTIWGMGGVAVLYALSMLLALVFSRKLSRSVESLSIITKDIPLKIEKQDMIVWPHMATVEMEQLTNNFKDTESALRKYVQEVRQSNVALEQKVQERTWELQNERQRLGDILYGTNSGTWEWNVQTGEASFNERWANIIGYDLQELEPISIQTWIDFTHPDDLKVSNEILEKHFKREIDYYECECRMKHKDGNWVWVLDRGKVVSWTEDSKPLTMSGTRQDVTDRKVYESSLIKTAKELKRLADLKSEFISITSHEIRTPLTSIKNAVDIIVKGKAGAINDGQGKFLSMAQRNINRLTTIINDMLNISKIEAGKMNYEYAQIDIRDITGNVINTLQPLANKKSIALNVDISPDLPVIFGDVDKIEQVLINLADNAIKFTPEQGAVTIEVHQGEVLSDMPEEATGYVEISVADTGIGISKEHQKHLFEKFYQVLHSLERKKEGGTGLGLAICKGIIDGHKGKIWCESTESKGSTFYFTLPGGWSDNGRTLRGSGLRGQTLISD